MTSVIVDSSPSIASVLPAMPPSQVSVPRTTSAPGVSCCCPAVASRHSVGDDRRDVDLDLAARRLLPEEAVGPRRRSRAARGSPGASRAPAPARGRQASRADSTDERCTPIARRSPRPAPLAAGRFSIDDAVARRAGRSYIASSWRVRRSAMNSRSTSGRTSASAGRRAVRALAHEHQVQAVARPDRARTTARRGAVHRVARTPRRTGGRRRDARGARDLARQHHGSPSASIVDVGTGARRAARSSARASPSAAAPRRSGLR